MTNMNHLEQGDQTHRAMPLQNDPVVILCEWVGRWIGYQVPVGCEDETGFHYEIIPAPSESSRSLNVQ